MATLLICPHCRRQYLQGTTCPCRPPKRRTGPARAAQARARTQALVDAGHRCVWIVDGVRCSATTNLEAAHVTRYVDTGSFAAVVMLCNDCHVAYDRQQRHQRLDRRP